MGTLLVVYGAVAASAARAATLTVQLSGGDGVTMVGAVDRWDQDGNARKLPNQEGKIDAPEVDAKATSAGGGKWVFEDLKPGRYDLVILADKTRIEGFTFVPVREFDPWIAPEAKPDDEAAEFIENDIRNARHYENKVEPFHLAGDDKHVRVLVQLLRDLPTTYKKGAGTIRHEIWEYTWNYGGWVKEKRTRVMDRILMQVSDLRQWTWLWDPKLGGIEVKDQPVTIEYQMPGKGEKKLKGLYPY
ncbi:MAG: hypothetical protein ACOY3P_21715 [Planctomycetota bacterium]